MKKKGEGETMTKISGWRWAVMLMGFWAGATLPAFADPPEHANAGGHGGGHGGGHEFHGGGHGHEVNLEALDAMLPTFEPSVPEIETEIDPELPDPDIDTDIPDTDDDRDTGTEDEETDEGETDSGHATGHARVAEVFERFLERGVGSDRAREVHEELLANKFAPAPEEPETPEDPTDPGDTDDGTTDDGTTDDGTTDDGTTDDGTTDDGTTDDGTTEEETTDDSTSTVDAVVDSALMP